VGTEASHWLIILLAKAVLRFWGGRSWDDVQFNLDSGTLETTATTASAGGSRSRSSDAADNTAVRGGGMFAVLFGFEYYNNKPITDVQPL
jgi:hypothetical protein